MISTLDRQNINRALAKALAYHNCGKPEQAKLWVVQLCRELQARDIVKAEYLNTSTME